MNLRRRQQRKHDRALDALASATKVWSEWQLGKRAAKSVAKVKEPRKPSRLKRVLSSKWFRLGGVTAVAGGTAAAVAHKRKGSEPEIYTGPPPSAAADAAVPAPDAAPPLSVAPDPATSERDTETVGGESTLRSSRDGEADGPSAETPSEDADEIARSFSAGPPAATAEPPDAAAEPPDAEPPDAEPPDAESERFAPGTTVDSQDAAAGEDRDADAEPAEADK